MSAMMQGERAEGNRNTALKIILNPFLSTRSLCLTANAGRDATESGTRDDRIWDEARPNLGRETTESGARGADKLRERGAEDYLTLQR